MMSIGESYQYIAIGFGGLFLVPQIVMGYKTGSLRDVSTTMLVFIVIGSGLWGYYMYESGFELYVYATGFLCISAILLIFMQLWQYYLRFKEHVNTFEQKPKLKSNTAPAPAPAPAQSIILEVKDKTKQTEEEKEDEENI